MANGKDEYVTRVKKYAVKGSLFDTKHTKEVREPLPSHQNPFVRQGKTLVSQIKVKGPLKNNIKHAIELMGGLGKSFKPSDSVLIIPNFNSDDPYPASTDPKFVEAVVSILQDFGIKKITVGNASGIHWLPTRRVMGNLGILKLADKMHFDVSCFEEKDWIKVRLNSDIIKDVSFAEDMFKFDKIVYLPSMKTHRRARFTMSLKLTVGLLCLKHRVQSLHTKRIEENIADLNKALCPDLIIMDARKIMVQGGPDQGKVVDHGYIFASGDRIANDIVGLRHLLSYKGEDNQLDKPNPEDYLQIKRAMKIGIGIKSSAEIEVVE